MKKKFLYILLAGFGAFAAAAQAQVEKIELDVSGYLCGL
jgi:hypothetical protein